MNTEKMNQKRCLKCGMIIPEDAPQGLCPKCLLTEASTATEMSGATNTSEIPSLERVRAAFPNLEIIELIGRGGMGFVFKARQPNLDRFVALKLLPEKLARDPLFTERFNREGRLLAKLNHPNIVSIYDFGKSGEFYYLMMEYVDGVNLRQAMRLGRFSPEEALKIVPKICEALQYAHQQGILHRDIKPENILIDSKGNVKLTDFGIAKLIEPEQKNAAITLTGTQTVLGTPPYIAPEQLESPQKVDHRADIYSLGVVFYELLTGELPMGRFEAPSSKTPVSHQVDEVVFKALEKNKEKRFQSAGEVKTKIEEIKSAGGVEPESQKAESAQESDQKMQVSKKAIFSFALAMIYITLFVNAVLKLLSTPDFNNLSRNIYVAGIMALVVGIVSTIYGWLSLNEIRNSQGKLTGTPLGITGALTFPYSICLSIMLFTPFIMVATPEKPSGLTSSIAILYAAFVISLSILVIVAVAKWVNRKKLSRETISFAIIIPIAITVLINVLTRRGEIDSSIREFGKTQMTSAISGGGSKQMAVSDPLEHGAERLPDGFVTLAAVYDVKNNIFWDREGNILTNLDIKPNVKRNPDAGRDSRALDFYFKINRFDYGNGITVLFGNGHRPIQYYTELISLKPDNNETGMVEVVHNIYPPAAKMASVFVGISSGEWSDACRFSLTSYPVIISTARNGENWEFYLISKGKDNKGNALVSVGLKVPDIKRYEFRVAAITQDNIEHKPNQSFLSDNFINATFDKQDVPYENLKEIVIRYREYKWAEFPNIRLYPKTN